jgi:hypothetical protein
MAVWRGTALVVGASGRVGSVVFVNNRRRQTIRSCCRGRGFVRERSGPGAVGLDDMIVSPSVSFARASRVWRTIDESARVWWRRSFGGEARGRQKFVSWWSRLDAFFCQYGMVNPWTGAPYYMGSYDLGAFAGPSLAATGGASYRVYWNLYALPYPFVNVWVWRGFSKSRVGWVRQWCGVQYVTDSGWYDWTAWLQSSPRNLEFIAGEMVRVELCVFHHWFAKPGPVQRFDCEVS